MSIFYFPFFLAPQQGKILHVLPCSSIPHLKQSPGCCGMLVNRQLFFPAHSAGGSSTVCYSVQPISRSWTFTSSPNAFGGHWENNLKTSRWSRIPPNKSVFKASNERKKHIRLIALFSSFHLIFCVVSYKVGVLVV